MSETTKDTEMEPCMTQKVKKKVFKNSFVTFVKKRALTAEKFTMLLENYPFFGQKLFFLTKLTKEIEKNIFLLIADALGYD